MKTHSLSRFGVMFGIAFTLISATSASAQTWIGPGGLGGDGDYETGTNWSGGSVPDTANGATATINSGNVTYEAGPDYAVNNGGTLRLNGGSWTQTTDISWIQLGGGNLEVAGGTFNQGTAGNIIKTAGTTVSVSAGAANFNGEYALTGSTFNLTGGTASTGANFVADTGTFFFSAGTLNVGSFSEFKPLGANATMTGGTMNANFISFDGTSGIFNFSGGDIVLDANGIGEFQGIFAAADGYLNYTTGSTGTLFVNGLTEAAAASLFDSRIRLDGVADIGNFTLNEADGGLYITAMGVIPEPATGMAMALGAVGLLLVRRRRRG